MMNRLSGATFILLAALLLGGCAAPWIRPSDQRRAWDDSGDNREPRRGTERKAALKPPTREKSDPTPQEDKDESAAASESETAKNYDEALAKFVEILDRYRTQNEVTDGDEPTEEQPNSPNDAARRLPPPQRLQPGAVDQAHAHHPRPNRPPLTVSTEVNTLRMGGPAYARNLREETTPYPTAPPAYEQSPSRGYDQSPPRAYDQSPPRGYGQTPPRVQEIPQYNPPLLPHSEHDGDAPPSLQPVSHTANDPTPKSFQRELEEAIAVLEDDLEQGDLGENERVRAEVVLRFLYLASADDKVRQQAIEHIKQLDETQRDYWAAQLFSLRTLLNFERFGAEDHRAKAALQDLRRAVNKLADIGSLEVRNVKLCTEVRDFGVYEEFPEMRFVQGQRAILYAEIDNFSSQQQGGQFETSLSGEYEIFSRDQRRIAVRKFNRETDICRSRRRDFFLPYPIQFPDDIPPGNYRLLLTVRDTKADKIDQAGIDFAISP